MTTIKSYKSVLVKLMSFIHETEYDNDREFTDQELSQVTPEQICSYMKLRAYGNANADIATDNPTESRSSSLEFWKKAISCFMPNNNMTWNELANIGNPTRSAAISKLIRKVKQKEAARLGKKSQKRRALYASEFDQAMEMMERFDDVEEACWKCITY